MKHLLSHQILPEFQRENKLQKVQCIVLTDGEANHLARHVEVQRRWENEPHMGRRQLQGGCTFLRDRKTGNTYQVPYGWHGFTDLMLQNLRVITSLRSTLLASVFLRVVMQTTS